MIKDLLNFEPQSSPYTTKPPFSFTYEGKSSAELLNIKEQKHLVRKLDDQRTEHTLTYTTDPKPDLVIRCVVIEYHDFPTVEWTLYFKNIGSMDTPIIENIQALDIEFDRNSTKEFLLHHNVGSPCLPSDYAPLETTLQPNSTKHISAAGGRPTNSDMSYFNLECGDEGIIIAIGWQGQWSSEFVRDDSDGIHIQAGQELTHFILHPGEEVRTPLIVLQYWNGDWIDAQNVWRRWMFAHNIPMSEGKPLKPQLFGCSSHFTDEMVNGNEENQIYFINRYLEEHLKIDYWWMDAGWYFCNGSWGNTGTWEVDTDRFPRGLRSISDYAHSNGIKIIVWFEPERVAPNTWLTQNHPEWILGGKNGGLLNLGNSEARNWLTDHVDKLITDQGIDLYREDFNIDPLSFWRANDTEDRQGITEIRYVEGHLAYWDELLRRHPNLLIDSCASGGRRNDLETMRRSVPLWRTDWRLDTVGTQCHTYGISNWIPLSGTGSGVFSAYDFRSNMVPFTNCIWDMRIKDADYELMRRLTSEFRQVADYYLGDYYPLSPYSLERETWMAWQFNCPDIGEGMIQAFRRDNSMYESARFKLKGLNPDAHYTVKNMDVPGLEDMIGSELMEKGLVVSIPNQPGAVIITYQKVR
jgi:alpha-galactosidase